MKATRSFEMFGSTQWHTTCQKNRGLQLHLCDDLKTLNSMLIFRFLEWGLSALASGLWFIVL